MSTSVSAPESSASAAAAGVAGIVTSVNRALARIPHSFIALVARFSIAAVFWKSGQTKIQGLAIDIVNGSFELGWPRLSDSAVDLPSGWVIKSVLFSQAVAGPHPSTKERGRPAN